MEEVERFDAWAKGLNLRYIRPAELRTKCQKGSNTIPPDDLWPNIVPTAWLVDLLREDMGKPVMLHSTYRSPSYNRSVGGASRSQHLRFSAIDFSILGVNPREVAQRLTMWRSVGVFMGGIGRYDGFVHLDTRGENVSWTG